MRVWTGLAICSFHRTCYRVVDELRNENAQLRQYGAEPSEVTNAHGKRPMMDVHRSVYLSAFQSPRKLIFVFHPHRHTNGAMSNSSPRSVMTPVGPDRLTLPPSHQQPSFSHKGRHSDEAQGAEEYSHRPGSRRIALEYALYLVSKRRTTITIYMIFICAGNMRTSHPQYREHNSFPFPFRMLKLHPFAKSRSVVKVTVTSQNVRIQA